MPTARPTVAAYAASRATADLSRSRNHSCARRTILVVGASDITQSLVHEVLTREGHVIVHARDSLDALLKATSSAFDAVVIASLPDGEAIDVVSAVRQESASADALVPVVFYTSSHDSARRLRAVETLKPAFTVVKDGNIRALVHTVDTALRLCG